MCEVCTMVALATLPAMAAVVVKRSRGKEKEIDNLYDTDSDKKV